MKDYDSYGMKTSKNSNSGGDSRSTKKRYVPLESTDSKN
jgi:hypothetical protein